MPCWSLCPQGSRWYLLQLLFMCDWGLIFVGAPHIPQSCMWLPYVGLVGGCKTVWNGMCQWPLLVCPFRFFLIPTLWQSLTISLIKNSFHIRSSLGWLRIQWKFRSWPVSSSNTRSAQKASSAISSSGYLRHSSWSGVMLLAAPERDRIQWAMEASRCWGMATDGFGVGAGVDREK